MWAYSNWQWHLDEVFVKISGETHYLWRAEDHKGEVLESYVTKHRDRKAALIFLRKMKRFGPPHVIAINLLRSYGAATVGLERAQVVDQCNSRRRPGCPGWRLTFNRLIGTTITNRLP